jgi:crotonobetainyl-CoA:carnitine CoA-transferase CaiB-like acyl-CoA transferase
MTGPLNDITLIDQTQALAGPYCSMILGDLGANVIKIEHPLLGPIKSLTTPIHFSHTGLTYRHHPPLLGEQTVEILSEVGYSSSKIKSYEAQGII